MNVFPTAVLRNSLQRPVLVELKNGTQYTGVLSSVDTWMNLTLTGVTCVMPQASGFFSVKEVVVRGNAVKIVRCEDAALQERQQQQPLNRRVGGPQAARPRLTAEERKKKFARKESRDDRS